MYKCSLCPRVFSSIRSQKRHYNSTHTADGFPAQGATSTSTDTTDVGSPWAAADFVMTVDAAGVGQQHGASVIVGGPLSAALSGDPTTVGARPPTALVVVSAAARSSGAGEWADGDAATYVSPIRNDWMARDAISGMRRVGQPSEMQRNNYVTNIASRTRGFYESLPEASQSFPCVDPALTGLEGFLTALR